MKKVFSCLLLSFLISFKVLSMDVPPLTGPVVDAANVLKRNELVAIDNALRNLYQTEGIQFQVLIVPELVNETIEGYSIKVVDQWKLGNKREDRGALFLISINDRKMRIEVGRGLEGNLTDLTSNRIIREVGPYFAKKDYGNGVALGLALMSQAEGAKLTFGDASMKPRHKKQSTGSLVIFAIIFIFYIFQLFFGRRRGIFIAGGGLGGGGFGGGFGGGGGWSGGGGGFGGGGSSGSW